MKYAYLLTALILVIVALVAVNVLEYQDREIEEFCANRTGLHGSEIVVNCTGYEADEPTRLLTYIPNFTLWAAFILAFSAGLGGVSLYIAKKRVNDADA